MEDLDKLAASMRELSADASFAFPSYADANMSENPVQSEPKEKTSSYVSSSQHQTSHSESNTLTGALSALQAKLKTLETEKKMLQESCRISERENESIRKQLVEKRAEITRQANEDAAQYEGQAKDLAAQIATLKNELSKREGENRALNVQLAQLRSSLGKQVDDSSARADRAAAGVNRLEAEARQLRAQIEAERAAQGDRGRRR
eukprot:gnl/Chilomastix_cuspidata/5163.p1 GENE.gnl/Chilomastix_cuspidata/5163~~gnl/Chilomastix_cuspidata/5163.p1  ORF type:complete len:205 (+),score=90.24 gnl/Chilomastix_cuspidata/5163:74-688(+)